MADSTGVKAGAKVPTIKQAAMVSPMFMGDDGSGKSGPGKAGMKNDAWTGKGRKTPGKVELTTAAFDKTGQKG